MTHARPVINISRKAPGQKPSKFARVTFPESAGPLDVVAMLTRFPAREGYLCDLRQSGPHGFSLPLDRAAYFGDFPGLGDYVESLLGLPRVVPFRRAA